MRALGTCCSCALVALVACHFDAGGAAGGMAHDGATGSDALATGSDAAVDAPPGLDAPGLGSSGTGSDTGSGSAFCVGGSGSLFAHCFDSAPTVAGVFTGSNTYSTDAGCVYVTLADSTIVCTVSYTSVDIPAGVTVKLTGSRPIVVISENAITIEGTLDVSSQTGVISGAGANFGGCAAGNGGDSISGGGGGAGGSFGQVGGNGGTGGNGAAGMAPAPASPMEVRGGCKGSSGGVAGASGGNSGGAIYLMSTVSIEVTASGIVFANGGGGGGTYGLGGGGGGGTGGLLGFDAPSVTLSGIFAANGGGGGEGGDLDLPLGHTGHGGNNGASSPALAAGGTGGSSGGGGGSGGGGTAAATSGTPSGGGTGGGGGGGSVGVIYVVAAGTPALTGAISPPVTHP